VMPVSESKNHSPPPVVDRASVPVWAIREDELARREDRADQAQGRYYIWLVFFAALPPLLALAWRLVA
jgi:hypothetical protein